MAHVGSYFGDYSWRADGRGSGPLRSPPRAARGRVRRWRVRTWVGVESHGPRRAAPERVLRRPHAATGHAGHKMLAALGGTGQSVRHGTNRIKDFAWELSSLPFRTYVLMRDGSTPRRPACAQVDRPEPVRRCLSGFEWRHAGRALPRHR